MKLILELTDGTELYAKAYSVHVTSTGISWKLYFEDSWYYRKREDIEWATIDGKVIYGGSE
jgi:hypothetical protein